MLFLLQIRGYIMWNGLDLDEAVWSVYQTCMGNAGSIEEARQIFDKMVDRDG